MPNRHGFASNKFVIWLGKDTVMAYSSRTTCRVMNKNRVPPPNDGGYYRILHFIES